MTGRMIHVAPEQPTPHTCTPPGELTCIRDAAYITPLARAAEPPGSLWRCSCGRLWVADDSQLWRHAGWRARWHWRKVQAACSPELLRKPTTPPTGPSGVSASRDGAR